MVLGAARLRIGMKWESGPGYRVARLKVPPAGHTGLHTPSSRIHRRLVHQPALLLAVHHHQNLLNGAGVCAGDFDGDGLVDLLFLQSRRE